MKNKFSQSLRNIFYLGVKELLGLWRDPMMLILILYSFTIGIYVGAKAQPDSLTKASIAIVDEDRSQLTNRICDSFMPPMFLKPQIIERPEIDSGMDKGKYTFVVVFPTNFEKDILKGETPEVQINVDATRMAQAFTGAGYIQTIISQEISKFAHKNGIPDAQAQIVKRNRFNPNLTQSWFSAAVQLINNISMLAIILTGAALIRERECGTLEHLLVLPLRSFEIMVSKIWAMALVVLATAGISQLVVIEWIMGVPAEGSRLLFMTGLAMYLFAVTSLGIFLACIAQNMPQLGILLILVLLPMEMLSGGSTPLESMPPLIQKVMQISPTTQFVSFSQALLYRGAGIDVVWKEMLALFAIGSVLFWYSWLRFKRSVA
ncbi:MAG: ABC transporter permease [Lentisphaeria bacterium]|nr:ABC transporter permease [Lentisphaeria bacterium]